MDYFPYLPQNPFTDKPEQDLSSQSVEIAVGTGMEAIIFGTFGIRMEGHKLVIKPYNHEDIGEATLKDIKYKGRLFSFRLMKKTFSVFEGEKLIATKFYGESVIIDM